jgi:hypothetical protein
MIGRLIPARWTVGARPALKLGLLVFLVTMAAAAYALREHRPLLTLDGLTDEWYPLGYNVAAYGTLGWGDEPILLRPPGYPAFIAGVLRLTTRVPRRLTPSYSEIATSMVCLAQAVLLAATAALLFAWLRPRVGNALAFAAALLYGLNPYSLVLPGLLHYDVLHLFLLVAGCLVLDLALARADVSLAPLAAAGALWGIAALVRPVTLPMPLLVLVMILARGLRGRRAVIAALTFSLAMAAVIAPWTARNYRLTGRLVPVNVQGWAALWVSTVVPLRLDPNEYQWAAISGAYLRPIYLRVTGEEYDYLGYLRHNVVLESALKEEALRNMRRQPQVYLWNVARGFTSLALQINTSLVSVFQRIQRTGETVKQSWFWEHAEAERAETRASRATGVLAALLTALAGIGIARAVVRRDPFLVVPGLVYLCVALAHALTLVDYMYYYVRLPFLIVFAALGTDALGAWGRRIAAGLVALALATSATLLLGL